MDSEGVTYKQAGEIVRKKVGEKEKEFILAGEAVLRDPELSRSVNVHRWLTSMQYILGGNIAFHQTVSTLGRCFEVTDAFIMQSGRYKTNDMPWSITLAPLQYASEDMITVNESVKQESGSVLSSNN